MKISFVKGDEIFWVTKVITNENSDEMLTDVYFKM